MSILVDRNTRLLVQGITGREGAFHTAQMLAYGTQVVAGVTPGKGGQEAQGVPVFDDVATAVSATGANASIIYVPAAFAAEAIIEAAEARIPLVVCISEGIPVWDMLTVSAYLEGRSTRLLGPNCPGIITPGQTKVGIMPGSIHRPGSVGVISRSGTLTYEVVHALTVQGLGQSTALGIGGDPIIGTDFDAALSLFAQDPDTHVVVLIGEIGGQGEERAAELIANAYPKPVVAFVAGRTAPADRRMGHAGAIVSGGEGDVQSKVEALRAAGVRIADHPEQVAERVREVCA